MQLSFARFQGTNSKPRLPFLMFLFTVAQVFAYISRHEFTQCIQMFTTSTYTLFLNFYLFFVGMLQMLRKMNYILLTSYRLVAYI